MHVEVAEKFFKEISRNAKEGYFEAFFVYRDDGQRFIQLASGQHPITGIVEDITDQHGCKIKTKCHVERSAILSIAQAADGTAIITLYPYKSEKSERKQKHIIWKVLDNPSEINHQLLAKATQDFFRYMRVSSVMLSESQLDRLRIYYLEFRCKKYVEGVNIYKAIFSHWFWIALGAISSFITIYHH